MDLTQPPTTLTPELERLLSVRPSTVRDAVRRAATNLRPCVHVTGARVADTPMHGSLLNRLLRRPVPPAILPLTASKFGGAPYCEDATELEQGRFIGQVNFAEVTDALQRQQFPRPDGMPSHGILAVDLVPSVSRLGRVRWYPNPREGSAVLMPSPTAISKYESALTFTGGWSLRGLTLFDAAEGDEELGDYLNEMRIEGVDEDDDRHTLFGHATEAHEDTGSLVPVSGHALRDYEQVWRIGADAAARFDFGTNWLYVMLLRDDVAQGAFERSLVSSANA